MKQVSIGAALLSSAIVFAPVLASAQQPFDIGKREYDLACAVCHGVKGKGDGPLAEHLKKPATDLTVIQKNNKGIFPSQRLIDIIDGREAIAAHGPREMTVWGGEFRQDATELCRGFGISSKDTESYVRGRIIILIGYIYTLQEK